MQNGRWWESLFSDYLGSAYPFKNWIKQTTQKEEIVGLFEPIGMGSRTEGASSPEMMNRMHADLQIEVEKMASRRWLENARLACPGQYCFSTKNDNFASPEWSPINWT